MSLRSLAPLALLVACSSAESTSLAPLVVEDGCQPLLASTTVDATSRAPCLLPFPSDFHRNGERVALRGEAIPKKTTGELADPTAAVPADGFSILATIVATLPSPIVREGLPSVLSDPNASMLKTSPSVLLEAESGLFVPHYVDVHDRASDEEHKPLVLRPITPLEPRTRYIVALQGVKTTDGTLAPPPEGFRRLRDRVDDPAFATMPRFEQEVFEPLARFGIPRESLQLAWTFTTGSSEQPATDMLRVRELTLAWLATNTPAAQVIEVIPEDDRLWKRVRLTLSAPLFLTGEGKVGAKLHRDASGNIAQNGMTSFEVLVAIPLSVRDRKEPGRALAFGHGFFGDKKELEGNAGRTIADKLAAVEFGIDWWGMSREDGVFVADTLYQRPQDIADFGDRVHQAMAHWIITTAAMRTVFTTLPELKRDTGELVYDPSFIGYFGASQGHILGGTLAALNPDLSRIVLNVGGGGFTHMMPRSGNFGPFSLVLDTVFRDPLMVQAFMAMFQRALDRIDPAFWAAHVLRDPIAPSQPDRRVLMQIGLGDNAVPNIASFFHARALGLKQTVPAPLRVFGLEEHVSGTAESALTVFDYAIDTSTTIDPYPLSPNEVHEAVRVNAKAIEQMDAFLRPNGIIVHPCDGACDPQ